MSPELVELLADPYNQMVELLTEAGLKGRLSWAQVDDLLTVLEAERDAKDEREAQPAAQEGWLAAKVRAEYEQSGLSWDQVPEVERRMLYARIAAIYDALAPEPEPTYTLRRAAI